MREVEGSDAIMCSPSSSEGASDPVGGAPLDRFFIDHGRIHDRATGRHVTTEPDEETWAGVTITGCCALLNELAAKSVAP